VFGSESWIVAAVTAVDVGIAEDDDLRKYFEKNYIYICIGFDFKRSSAQ